MSLLNKYKDDFIVFLELGFIAVNFADEDSASKLFKAAQLLKPESVFPILGMGYLHLHKLEIKQAMHSFEQVLAKDPNNEMAKTLLGLTMTFSVNRVAEGEKLLEETKKSHDDQIKKLSSNSLEFVDKFVKKAPSPVQVAPKGKKARQKL